MAVVHCKVIILMLLMMIMIATIVMVMMMLKVTVMKKMMMNMILMTPAGGQRTHGVDDMCLSASSQTVQVSDQDHSFHNRLRWPIQIGQICLSFYPHPNILDRFPSHFIRIKIFQIYFPIILYL